MQFIPAIDIWHPSVNAAVRSGAIKLQVGQPIRLGRDGPVSRFHHANRGHICAFHGPRAMRKLVEYVAAGRAHDARCKARDNG